MVETRTKDLIPVANVEVTISSQDETGKLTTIATLFTNSSGQTPIIVLDAPILSESEDPNFTGIPYATYHISTKCNGYIPVIIEGSQIFSEVTSIQPITLMPIEDMTVDPFSFDRQLNEVISIGQSTLIGDYAPKIPESETKDVSATGFVVLSEVVVPEYIIVYAGSPNSTGAPTYTVRFRDYIKNVASSEIYPTWPRETIKANVIAIISFTLNRVYTEWYRNQGKTYTITNSTAVDQAFIYGRNIFDTISSVVDECFDIYIKRPGVIQPLLAQYCDGQKSTCPGWMTQWGSQQLGEDGLKYDQILRYFYGNTIEILSAKVVSGIPESYPGTALREGSQGTNVRIIQEQLNRISNNYPLIPKVPTTGIFDPQTTEAVKVFQRVFHLTPDGIVGKSTWYKLSYIYVAVTKIAELT
ncbi:MAG: peptidoglycan-binding protein [Epulopiscium sp. Nuni2H_MBin003]|nr:MAG: peptidoglycan-binding protein [Epulopiscium sp. Nuni2H_MBin003]